VSGTDIDGDRWVLTLLGPGTINVVDKNAIAFTKSNETTPNLINTITVAGTNTSQSRLVGKVIKGANGDGKVFFQNLNVTSSGSLPKIDANEVDQRATLQVGIAAIDMPQFWLGHTDGTAPTLTSNIHTAAKKAGQIYVPDGVNALRFGGVDATYTPPGGTPLTSDGQNDEFVVNLGLPITTGTSIIVDRVVSAGQAATSSTTPATQKMVSFVVSGRLNLFQANEIDGDTTNIPSQFVASTATGQPGGTYVVSQGGLVTGAIGDIRIGGDATNFTAFANSTALFAGADDNATDPKISNFFIGGETQNVILVAPGGSRNVSFGRGMDTVQINSLAISSLQANRGAIGSDVTVTRSIGNMLIGGDVVDTNVQAGYQQNLASISNTPGSILSSGNGVFNGVPVPTIINRVQNLNTLFSPLAHNGGSITARIAGDVQDSTFAASVDPNPSGIDNPGFFDEGSGLTFPFGAPNNIVLPRGVINAKVEGNIDNSNNPLVSVNAPANSAFFAKRVDLKHGPIIPPNVAEPPYEHPTEYHTGQNALKGLAQFNTPRRQRRRS
jgi:hypothetical protein